MGDLFDSPDEVVIATDGDTYTSAPLASAGLGAEAGEPNFPERTAWWAYVPATSGSVTIDTHLTTTSTDRGTVLRVYTGPALDALTLLGESYYIDSDEMSELTLSVDAGVTYRIQVDGFYEDQNYVLRAVGPANAPVDPFNVDSPPLRTGLKMFADRVDLLNDNDRFDRPITITITNSAVPYLSAARASTDYDVEPDEVVMFGGRSAWWVYTPRVSGSLHVTSEYTQNIGGGRNAAIAVWTGDTVDDLTLVGWDNDSGWDEIVADLTVPVTGGVTYRIQMTGSNRMNYRLWAQGPESMGIYLDAPPIGSRLSVLVPVGDPVDTLDAVPVAAGVELDADDPRTLNIFIDAVPIGVGVAVRITSALRFSRTLMSPVGAATVPLTKPAFTVAVTLEEGTATGVFLDIQYADNPAFTDAVTLTANEPVLRRTNSYTLWAEDDLDAGLWYWRARLRAEDATMPWTAPATFIIDTSSGDYEVDLVWTVTSGLTRPHVWFVDPASGVAGEVVTLYGQGFPNAATHGVVRFRSATLTAESWTTVAADPDVDPADRVIDLADNRIDAGHDEVQVILTDLIPGVGGFTVEGD